MTEEEQRAIHRKTFSKPTMTKQDMADECDINTIVGKHRQTGFMEHVNLQRPVYNDFSSGVEYNEALNSIMAANDLFESLPARVRARCDNDPAKLIEFVEDEANAEELVELGLKNPVTERAQPLAAATEGGTEGENLPPITNLEGP